MEIVFHLREVMLNSGFQNIRRTNYAIPFTTSDSSIYNSNKYFFVVWGSDKGVDSSGI